MQTGRCEPKLSVSVTCGDVFVDAQHEEVSANKVSRHSLTFTERGYFCSLFYFKNRPRLLFINERANFHNITFVLHSWLYLRCSSPQFCIVLVCNHYHCSLCFTHFSSWFNVSTYLWVHVRTFHTTIRENCENQKIINEI